MFTNLKAEMARNGHKSADVAEVLGISRQSYELKMRTGKFTGAANYEKDCLRIYRPSA